MSFKIQKFRAHNFKETKERQMPMLACNEALLWLILYPIRPPSISKKSGAEISCRRVWCSPDFLVFDHISHFSRDAVFTLLLPSSWVLNLSPLPQPQIVAPNIPNCRDCPCQTLLHTILRPHAEAHKVVDNSDNSIIYFSKICSWNYLSKIVDL